MEFTLKQIASLINGTIEGNPDLLVQHFVKIEENTPGGITFLANLKYEPYFYKTQASAVIVSNGFEPKKAIDAALIRVENPEVAVATLLKEYEKFTQKIRIGIEQPSLVGASTTYGNDVYIGAFAHIGEHCKIGNNVKIYPQVWIDDNVVIGDNSIIHAGAKIYKKTIIGQNCVLFANVVVGGDGFGFARSQNGIYERTPQLGNVVIEDHVSIGSNSTIDRATLSNESTIIRRGVKIDNLVQIAHNVEIGRNSVIAAQAGIAGSTKIGEECRFGGQVGIAGHIKVANRTEAGGQTGITSSVEEPGLKLNGTPHMKIKDNLRSLAIFRRLPALEKKIASLEKLLKDILDTK
jgi:UDP-3-O-[3-hydroxymyristoyl] glucosamine N-acyltransferase